MSVDPWLSIEEIARRVRAHEASAEEVARATLERIARLDTRIGSFITVTADEAIAAARAVDRGSRDGALTGVPIALKDLFDTAGVRTTAGSRFFADRVPSEDAHVVRRLRAAGAISVGKTNLHELAYGVTTQNPHFGPTRDPWDPSRVPGGSSGGSGAALAAGLCAGALGSDTGGSIRIPASLCGIVGLKPTYGRVSLRGAVPLSWTLDHAGPMARSVRDVALLYAAIAGYDALDPASIDAPMADPFPRIEAGVRGLRVGVPRTHFFERCDAAVAELVRAAIRVLEREGARVEECAFPDSELLLVTQRVVLSADAAAYHADRMRERPEDFGPDVLARLSGGAATSGPELALARRRREEIRREVAALFARVDLLAVPTTAIAAPLAETADANERKAAGAGTPPAVAEAARLTALTSPFNLTGLPAISVPCGFDAAGLPVGLQLAGRAWDEATVLRAARAYERATEWTARHPAIAST